MPRLRRSALLFSATVLAAVTAQPVAAEGFDLSRWPDPATISGARGELVSYPSHSPFTLREVGRGETEDPGTPARAALFVPQRATAAKPVPAVVLLHGAAGVLNAREITYAGQFAEMGVAALVVDAFGARRDRGTGFVQRLLEVTETMVLADAYAGLRFLDSMPEIDGRRVALIGFSYGGIAATLGAFEQTAETLSPNGPRFAAHVSYYGPCIARFDDHRATGAPVLMLAGSEDAIVNSARCNKLLDDLRAGGAETEFVIYQGAFHQWDGSFRGPRIIGRNLADCRFKVGRDGVVRDSFTFLHMTGPLSRRLILAACVDSEGYLIGRDDGVRAKSNRAVGQFLTRAFAR
ncbi:MAG: dienelactone hydrolase family protein [Alphaproteobacteria bacterium]|nr:dienelactone hydrolase family protein [Alphaproteobacteria bacterium]